MGVNSFPKTVTRQRRDCDLNAGPSAPESSTLTTRLPSHPDPSLTLAITRVPYSRVARDKALYNPYVYFTYFTQLSRGDR